jgi:hypothetical protein
VACLSVDSCSGSEPSYRATLVEPGQALLTLIRYLHLRPVSAGAATDPADSALCSHRAYLGIVHIPWLTTSAALRMLAPSLERGRLEYRWMMDGTTCDEGEFALGRSLRERRMESLQIRAAPAPPEDRLGSDRCSS